MLIEGIKTYISQLQQNQISRYLFIKKFFSSEYHKDYIVGKSIGNWTRICNYLAGIP